MTVIVLLQLNCIGGMQCYQRIRYVTLTFNILYYIFYVMVYLVHFYLFVC